MAWRAASCNSASVASLYQSDPNAFYPFTIADWTHSPWTEFRSCIKWPTPFSRSFSERELIENLIDRFVEARPPTTRDR